ncbi:hypothetical protein [Desulfovibrio ferrophilus]|uniref:Uncharacterized protein n=1 Tax=Desulfovibrio ferrophilus TaxID=241368 RepID=A0A2Z6AYP8_9BACT|nr:hypothetical protein [Desulfovibrio ferrophilus]BBD08369.1 uncharacterized protein DFE_1643 [Desulfovibrio ferrophilus]
MSFGVRESFFAIENDLLQFSRYVDFSEGNLQVFSYELARLLLIIGSEVDIAFKVLCKKLCGESEFKGISQYKKCLLSRDLWIDDDNRLFNPQSPLDETDKVYMPRHHLTLFPWAGFSLDDSPKWWKSYNAVKHDRLSSSDAASLKNVLLASSALFYIVSSLGHIQNKLFWDDNSVKPGLRLFVMKGFMSGSDHVEIR